jgi:hypothetical protein
MSQVSHPAVPMPTKIRSIWIALPAFIAAAAVAVALALSGGDSTQQGTVTASNAGVDEASVAAAISGTSQESSTGVDESRVAASISDSSSGSDDSVEYSNTEEIRSDPHGTAIVVYTQ